MRQLFQITFQCGQATWTRSLYATTFAEAWAQLEADTADCDEEHILIDWSATPLVSAGTEAGEAADDAHA